MYNFWKGALYALAASLVFWFFIYALVKALDDTFGPDSQTHDPGAERCFVESPEIDPACARHVDRIGT